jgi:hypothetical protein
MPGAAQRIVGALVLAPFLAAGPCLLVVAAALGWQTESFIRSSLAVDGTVVELYAHRPGHGSDTYAPVFTYTADDGQTYRVTSRISSNPPAFAPGQHVRVLFLKGQPGTARIGSFKQLWTAAFTCGIVGAVFSCVSIVLIRRLRLNPAAARN